MDLQSKSSDSDAKSNFIVNSIVFMMDCIIFIPFLLLTSILYFLWSVYFVKKLQFFNKERSKALEKAKYDILGNFSQLAENHKIEVVKYSLLFIINIIELIAFSCYGIVLAASYFLSSGKQSLHFPGNVEQSNCTLDYVNVRNMQTVTSIIPELSFVLAVGQIGMLLTMTLCICLIRYLHNSYYGIAGNFRWISRFLSLTSLVCIILIVFSVIPQLLILQRIIEPIIQSIFLGLLVKHIRMFHNTLKRQTIDMGIICKPSATIQASIRLVKQYGTIATLNCMGLACFITAEFVTQYTFVTSIAIYFSPCFTEFAYGKVFYQPPLVDSTQIDQLKKSITIVNWVENVLFCIGCICLFSHYFLISFFHFGSRLWRDFRIRFGVSRHTPIIYQPLII